MTSLSIHHSPIPPCALPRDTAFGQFISTLYDDLRSLPDNDHPTDSWKWLVAALPKISQFYTPDLTVSQVNLTPADQLFLMGDPIGDVIRRVHLHKWLSERVQECVDEFPESPPLSPGEKSFLSNSVEWIRRFGFSSFVVSSSEFPSHQGLKSIVPEIDIQITSADFKTMMRGPGPFLQPRIAEFFVSLREEINRKATEIAPWYRVVAEQGIHLTDPNHLWSALYLTARFLWQDKSTRGLPERLETPERLMVVEDSPVHQLAFEALRTIENLSWFTPHHEHPVAVAHVESLRGCYPNAESALATIEYALVHNTPLPTVICSDIELSRDGMDGLTLMEKVDALLKESGRRDEVVLATVYSSHLSLFEDRIDALVTAGVINRAWCKIDFDLKDFLLAVQSARKAHSNPSN